MKKKLQIGKDKHAAYMRQWYRGNKKKIKKTAAKLRKKRRANLELRKSDAAYQLEYSRSESQKAYRRDWKMKNRYGISAAEYDEMLMEQGGVCAICKGESGNTRLVVDHDHERGQVRAILCHSCNVGLGMLEDDPARLKKAIHYLKRYES